MSARPTIPPRQRSTRIVATLDPSSSTPAMIRRLVVTGVDVFRLNFSHGSHADHGERVQLTIRVSGYAANFIKLTREQQLDVISRTFHAMH